MYFFLKNDFINTKNKFPIHIFIDLSNTIYQHVQIMNEPENFHRPLCFFNTPASYSTHILFFYYIRRLSLDFCCKSTTIISQNPWSYTYIEEMPLNYFTDLCTKNLTKDNVMRFYEYWNDGLGEYSSFGEYFLCLLGRLVGTVLGIIVMFFLICCCSYSEKEIWPDLPFFRT